jgi:hypothetical protein
MYYNSKRLALRASEATRASRQSPQMKRPPDSGDRPTGYWANNDVIEAESRLTPYSLSSINDAAIIHNGMKAHLYEVFCLCNYPHFCNDAAAPDPSQPPRSEPAGASDHDMYRSNSTEFRIPPKRATIPRPHLPSFGCASLPARIPPGTIAPATGFESRLPPPLRRVLHPAARLLSTQGWTLHCYRAAVSLLSPSSYVARRPFYPFRPPGVTEA